MTLLYEAPAFEFDSGVIRDGRQCVRLLKPFTLKGITVPAGFVSDFASVPWFADGLFPSFGPYAPAAIIHDWLYANGGKVREGTFTRKQADDLFLEIMAELGISWWKRSLMYRAVRLGGGSGWARG